MTRDHDVYVTQFGSYRHFKLQYAYKQTNDNAPSGSEYHVPMFYSRLWVQCGRKIFASERILWMDYVWPPSQCQAYFATSLWIRMKRREHCLQPVGFSNLRSWWPWRRVLLSVQIVAIIFQFRHYATLRRMFAVFAWVFGTSKANMSRKRWTTDWKMPSFRLVHHTVELQTTVFHNWKTMLQPSPSRAIFIPDTIGLPKRRYLRPFLFFCRVSNNTCRQG